MSIDLKFPTGKEHTAHICVDMDLISRFAEFSGDQNPLHVDAVAAKEYGYARPVAHGVILTAVLSRIIGMEVPGPGALWLSQSIEWLEPVFEGDEIDITVTVNTVSSGASILILSVSAKNQKGKLVMKGNAKVKVVEKVSKVRSNLQKGVKRALITGASRGIGADIAFKLAESGFCVALNYRSSRSEAQHVQKKIADAGGKSVLCPGDVSSDHDLDRIYQSAVEQMGGLDVVVHGASPTVVPTKVTELKYSDLERFFNPYLKASIQLIEKASPAMAENKYGRFIFIGTSYLFGMPPLGMAAYVIAKEALWGLVKSAASELGPLGITVNMVSPSVTVTEFTADIPARLKEIEARKSPIRRLAQVEDTAALVGFLAGETAGYINGQNIALTGGPV